MFPKNAIFWPIFPIFGPKIFLGRGGGPVGEKSVFCAMEIFIFAVFFLAKSGEISK